MAYDWKKDFFSSAYSLIGDSTDSIKEGFLVPKKLYILS